MSLKIATGKNLEFECSIYKVKNPYLKGHCYSSYFIYTRARYKISELKRGIQNQCVLQL